MHYHKTRQTVTSKTTQKQIQRTINNNSENQCAIRNRLIIKNARALNAGARGLT